MDIYASTRRDWRALPDISDDIIFIISVFLAFASGALFIYWLRRESLAKQQKQHHGALMNMLQNTVGKFEHLSAEAVSVQASRADEMASRFDRLEDTLRQMSQRDPPRDHGASIPSGVQDIRVFLDTIHSLERKIDGWERRSTVQEAVETEPQLRASSPMSSHQTQTVREMRQVIPVSDPEVTNLQEQLSQVKASHDTERQTLMGYMEEYRIAIEAWVEEDKNKNNKIAELESELEREKDTAKNSRKITDLEIELQEKEQVAAILEEQSNKITELERELEEKEQIITSLQEQSSEMAELEKDMNGMVISLQEQNSKITELERELEEKEQMVSNLNDQVKSPNKRHAQATESFEEDGLRQERNTVNLESELEQKTLMVESLDDALTMKKLSGFEKDIETIKLEREEYKSRVDQLDVTNKSLCAEIKLKTSTLTQTEDELRAANKVLIKWEQEGKAMAEERKKHEKSLADWSAALDRLEAEEESSDDEVSDEVLLKLLNMQTEKIGLLEQMEVMLEKALSCREKDVKDLQKEKDLIQKELEDLKMREETDENVFQPTDPVAESLEVGISETNQGGNTTSGDISEDNGSKDNSDSTPNATDETMTPAINKPVVSPESSKKRNWDDEADEDEDRISDSELRKFEADTEALKNSTLEPRSTTVAGLDTPDTLAARVALDISTKPVRSQPLPSPSRIPGPQSPAIPRPQVPTSPLPPPKPTPPPKHPPHSPSTKKAASLSTPDATSDFSLTTRTTTQPATKAIFSQSAQPVKIVFLCTSQSPLETM
ncbi:hypothetical protein PTNB73_02843 [Pyrenophora teres f. teres]|nr:hypothetical protein PTNB73_02843 [Pyrenophora teres f. teres]